MNDRELLELAAKAAGMTIDTHYVDGGASVWMGEPHNSDWVPNWNPLTDDGDALRLAVKLGLNIMPTPDCAEPWVDVCGAGYEADELYGNDPYAATRRAIVRAAAEIGKAKL